MAHGEVAAMPLRNPVLTGDGWAASNGSAQFRVPVRGWYQVTLEGSGGSFPPPDATAWRRAWIELWQGTYPDPNRFHAAWNQWQQGFVVGSGLYLLEGDRDCWLACQQENIDPDHGMGGGSDVLSVVLLGEA
jgi:hypothetical protein